MIKIIVTPEGTIELDLTTEEIAQREQDAINEEQDRLARLAKEQQEVANKQSALIKLKAIGLTDEEINSLLGV